MTQTLTNNLDIAKHCYDLFNQGQVETLLNDFMAPNIAWTEPETLPEGGLHTGPQEVMENVFGTFAENWGEDAQVTAEQWFGDGDTVVVQGHFRGTAPATGTAYEIPFCHVMTIENGRLTRFQNFTDTALALTAING